jgi:hypothetical protein
VFKDNNQGRFMKIAFSRRNGGQERSSLRWLGGSVIAGLLLAAVNLFATGATVSWVSGGPNYGYPTGAGYVNGDIALDAEYHTPSGIAVDLTGNYVLVADRDNNAIRFLQFDQNTTYTFGVDNTNLINKPVGVALDSSYNVFVLNRGNGKDGTVVEFDNYGDTIATNITSLTNAGGIALDTSDDIYVTASNTVFKITPLGVSNVVTTITYPGASLQGIVVKRSGPTAGLLAVCDSGRNGIYLINPTGGAVTTNAGFHGAGDFTSANNIAPSNHAAFFQPSGLAEAGDGSLVVTDFGNHRVKVVQVSGVVTNLYGVSSNDWVYFNTPPYQFPGFLDGTVVVPDQPAGVAARQPFGVAFAPDGSIYVTEDYYHIIRHVTGAGFPPPPPPPPASPTALTATAGYGQVVLAWTASAGATNYNIKRSTSSGGETTIASATSTAYTDTNVLDGTLYYYVISALNTGGESPVSGEVSATPLFSPAPANLIVVTTNFGLVSLAWSTSVGATSYNVKRAPSHGGPYATIASASSGSYNDTSVVDGTTYYYVVSAVNDGGENPTNSNEVSATPPLPPVPNPQIGWVTFPPTAFTSVFNVGTPSGVTFNNDVPIVIIGAAGSQTFYTYSNTPAFTNFPDPTSASSSAPVGYIDGLSSVAGLTVAQVLPNVAIKAIGEQSGHPNSAIVSALFQFVVANPGVYGANAALFSVSNITVGAQMYYTTDGTDPTNDGSGTSIGPITSGTTLSLSSTSTNLHIRGFKANYQPSSIVTNVFSTASFLPNAISFGTASGEPASKFMARPGQFYYAPVTLEMLSGFGGMYSLQFNVTVTNGLVNTNTGIRPPPIVNGAGIDFFSMLMTQVTPAEGLFNPPADGNWYLPLPAYVPYFSGGITNLIPSVFVNTNNNLLGIGWLYRVGIKYFAADTNGAVFLDFDTTKQDLTAYSIAHDTLFNEAGGKIVVGAYSFLIPTNASIGDKYFIQLGSPSATKDGVGAPGASIYIQPPPTNQAVTVGSPAYIVGDVAPFHWLNAGDFGDTNLDNSDVMQVYQAAILDVDMPPVNSDLYQAMDSSGNSGFWDGANNYYTNSFDSYFTNSPANAAAIQALFDGNDLTINTNIFGDGNLDVSDLYVTFRRSLDTSLLWFERYWTNGQLVAVTTTNLASNTNIPSALVTKSATKAVSLIGGQTYTYQQSSILFTAGDALGSAGQQVQIPITANVFGSYPLRVLGLNLTVYPLDGSPDLTQPVQFTPAAGLGQPTAPFSSTKGNDTYAAAWLDSTITGITGSTVIGTLTITIPAGATGMSAYAIHFNHASGSPNGLVSFPRQTFTGLITTSSRTNSYYNDGIPDSWRLRWFGTIYNLLSVSNACPSGDGVNNWKKYVAGVDPNTANDFPSLNSKKPVPAGATTAMHWPTISGKQYVILRSSSLFAGSWTAIATNTGTGTDMEFDDTTGGKVQFYRVQILP